ncbi:hypothetical protein B484DRAFT_402162 [Ochromonadaceae sp. CCMP2298]|nr:hypothetical protein B484DRAFT_402162 [Ochromonadaceae sp. CCMP2298]
MLSRCSRIALGSSGRAALPLSAGVQAVPRQAVSSRFVQCVFPTSQQIISRQYSVLAGSLSQRSLVQTAVGGGSSSSSSSSSSFRAVSAPTSVLGRGLSSFKNPKPPKALKTKKAAAKRFIVTGSGRMKCGHSGKGHLNTGKSRVRLNRLNDKMYLKGTMLRNMRKLILDGR